MLPPRPLAAGAGCLIALLGATTQLGLAQQPGASPSPPAQEPKALQADAKARLKQVGENEFELGGIRMNSATREIRIPTKVNLKKAPVEYALVNEMGKTHESILATAVKPTDVQVALLLCHYEPASEGLFARAEKGEEIPFKETSPKTAGAHKVMATVEWKDGAETKRAPLSAWFQNVDTRQPPADIDAWIFNGSYIDERGFVAEADGSIISVWVDRNAILNSPAKGNLHDELWATLPESLPDEGTPVTLILSAPTQKKSPTADKKP